MAFNMQPSFNLHNLCMRLVKINHMIFPCVIMINIPKSALITIMHEDHELLIMDKTTRIAEVQEFYFSYSEKSLQIEWREKGVPM